jgi:tRNA dimethylallyltransferase
MQVAEAVGAPILSIDSMQVYRGLDIGTAKPTPADRQRVTHLMIDLAEPEETFTAAMFQWAAREIIDSGQHEAILLVGGSGLHLRAVVDPLAFPPHDPVVRQAIVSSDDPAGDLLRLDPEAGSIVDLNNPRRVARALEVYELTGATPSDRLRDPSTRAVREYQSMYQFRAVGLDPGEELGPRIGARIKSMAEAGLLSEVRHLHENRRFGATTRNAVGYRQLIPVVEGNLEVDAGFQLVRSATNALARRQRTFFRRDPRIAWIRWRSSASDRLTEVREAWGL